MPTITQSIGHAFGSLAFCVHYNNHKNGNRQLMAAYSFTPWGFLRARAYAREMRIVYALTFA